MVPDFQERWSESRRKRRLAKRVELEVEQDQIDELLVWGKKYGADAVKEGLRQATLGGWQGLGLKPPPGSSNRPRPGPAIKDWKPPEGEVWPTT